MTRRDNDAVGTRAGRRPVRWYAFGAAVVAVVAVVVFLWLSAAGDDDPSDAASVEPTSTVFPSPTEGVDAVEPVAPFTQADADRITAALNSGDAATVGAVLVPELREPFAAADGEVLPAGATAALRTEQFVAVEPALGGVPLVVSGEQAGNFLLIVSHVEGQWLVVSTEEVQ